MLTLYYPVNIVSVCGHRHGNGVADDDHIDILGSNVSRGTIVTASVDLVIGSKNRIGHDTIDRADFDRLAWVAHGQFHGTMMKSTH